MNNLKDKKLILFFTNGISLKRWEELGGLDREIKPYNFLANNFKKIYFITYGKKNEELKLKKNLAENIEILPKKNFLSPKIYQFLIPFIYGKALRKADIYKTNQMAAVIPAIISKWLYKKKLVIRCGYEWLSFLEEQKKPFWKRKIVYLIEKIVYKESDKIILSSKKDKKFIIERFKINPKKIEVIPNYVDTRLFKPLNTKKAGVIFVGRLDPEKNLFNLIEAVSETSNKLVIIGSGTLEENLKNFAEEKKAQVEFRKNIPNEKLPQELNKSEIFILPSFYEGCPKTLLEAMSCGLSCIGTGVKGIKEIISHKENGYLCRTDASSIRKAISGVIERKNLRKRINKNARETISRDFSFERILEKEKQIYENL